jgi:nucleotide-binding universal stress UspA family protein
MQGIREELPVENLNEHTKVLVAYDGSGAANAAVDDLRKAGLPERGEARVVCVAHGEFQTHESAKDQDGSSWTSRLGEAEALAETATNRLLRNFPNWTVSSEALWGEPAKVLLDVCGRWHPDLLVVGSHGRSTIARMFLGSVSLELVHKAPCSVRITRSVGSSNPRGPIQLIIAHDGSPESEAIIHCVSGRRWPDNSEARIVSVIQPLVPATTALDASTFAQEPAYALICAADERMRLHFANIASETTNALRRAGLIATHSIIDGDPREVLLSKADEWRADTIFIGARGLGRMERLFLGSVSSHIVTHAHCTVEVVRRIVNSQGE